MKAVKQFIAHYRFCDVRGVPDDHWENVTATSLSQAKRIAKQLEGSTERHWKLTSVYLPQSPGAGVAAAVARELGLEAPRFANPMIFPVLVMALLLCSTADAGRCEVRMQRQRNRACLIQQGVPRMRAEAGLNRSRALLNFSKPFNIWGWIFP